MRRTKRIIWKTDDGHDICEFDIGEKNVWIRGAASNVHANSKRLREICNALVQAADELDMQTEVNGPAEPSEVEAVA